VSIKSGTTLIIKVASPRPNPSLPVDETLGRHGGGASRKRSLIHDGRLFR
jgi:hypothetical protein